MPKIQLTELEEKLLKMNGATDRVISVIKQGDINNAIDSLRSLPDLDRVHLSGTINHLYHRKTQGLNYC